MSRLEVKDFSLWLHLGVSAEERKFPQEVRLSFDLLLPSVPAAVKSDQIEDTLCYGKLCEALRETLAPQEFCTIERVAGAALSRLQESLPGGTGLRLRVHKVRPPVPQLLGGVVFETELL